MSKDDHIQYWLKSAANDLKAADCLFQSGKYAWCLFPGHLVLEKSFRELSMAQIPDKIKVTIDKYLKALKDGNIPVKQAFLFGSYANGNYNKYSDIDIALVSEIFEGNRIKDRSKIRRITLSVSSNIEVLPYAAKDFNTKNPFVKEILRTGFSLKL